MQYFPAFLNIRQRPCLVVGGGEIAARKIDLLRRAGAEVSVIAPELCSQLADLSGRGQINHVNRTFLDTDVQNVALVIAATNSETVNRAVSQAAHQANIPVNVVDQPELCSFIVPAIVDRSPLVAAISTGGAAPVLARFLRSRLESTIPTGYGKLAALAERFRGPVKARLSTGDQRRRFWERVLQGPVAELMLAGNEQKAAAVLAQELDSEARAPSTTGEVYLVGAGPGDPDLLTFRALRLMQQAEVVLYDRLVASEILDMTRRDAEKIYVGKRKSEHTLRQEQINQLLVDYALQGKRVLRLKGGDPFIFGRGGEEIDTLAEHGIAFQVVPGITAASGCAAYAGIPLTHRDYAQSCVFVTGHLQHNKMDLNWNHLVQPQQTAVIYMGLTGLPVICEQLIQHGMSPDMPVALIEQGTTRQQRVLTGTLSTLPALVEATDVHAPTLIIVGEVVRLRDKLAWFEPEMPAGLVGDHQK